MKAIGAVGGNASAFQGDVKQASDWAELVKQTVERFRRVDVLAKIAGVLSVGPDNILDQTEEVGTVSWTSTSRVPGWE